MEKRLRGIILGICILLRVSLRKNARGIAKRVVDAKNTKRAKRLVFFLHFCINARHIIYTGIKVEIKSIKIAVFEKNEKS